MKRKKSNEPTRILKFGCKPPTVAAELVREQLYAANCYYNRCIELRARSIAEHRDAQAQHWPELKALEEDRARIRTALATATKAEQKALKKARKPLAKRAAELRAEIKTSLAAPQAEMKRRIGDASTWIAKTRREEAVAEMLQDPQWSPWWKAQIQLKQDDIERRNEAYRSATGYEGRVPVDHQGKPIATLMHGTCDACQKAADAAWTAYFEVLSGKRWATPKTRARAAERGRPRFSRFDGSGTLRVQLRESRYNIAPADETFAVTGQWIRVTLSPKRTPVVDAAHAAPTPGSKRQQRLAEEPGWGRAQLRIGSSGPGGLTPIWTELPIRVHRRVPDDCALKWASLVVKREGPRLRYELQLTAQSGSFGALPQGYGVAAINYGWRSLGDGSFRLATLVDEHGNVEHLILPAGVQHPQPGHCGDYSVSARLAHADALQSHQDNHFNAAREALICWLRQHPSEVSEALAEKTQHIGQWRNPAKLVKAARVFIAETGSCADHWEWWHKWKRARLDAKADLFDTLASTATWLATRGHISERDVLAFYLHTWVVKQQHLYRGEARQRAKSVGHRRQLFQCWGKERAQRYARLLIEEYDMREIEGACRTCDDEESDATKRARKNRTRCAPGEARSIMRRIAGGKVVMQPAKTPAGHGASQRCTACGSFSPVDPEQVMVACPACQHVEDQDVRNCINRLRDYFEQSGGAGEPGSARNSKEHTASQQTAACWPAPDDRN